MEEDDTRRRTVITSWRPRPTAKHRKTIESTGKPSPAFCHYKLVANASRKQINLLSQWPLLLISTGFPLYLVTKLGRPRLSLFAITAMHCSSKSVSPVGEFSTTTAREGIKKTNIHGNEDLSDVSGTPSKAGQSRTLIQSIHITVVLLRGIPPECWTRIGETSATCCVC